MAEPSALLLFFAVFLVFLPFTWRLLLLGLIALVYTYTSPWDQAYLLGLLLPLVALFPAWHHRVVGGLLWALGAAIAAYGLPPLDWASGLPVM